MNVYNILFPLTEHNSGMAHLAVLNQKKEMKSLGGCFFADLPKRIEQLDIMKSRDYYITANATIPFRRRCADNLLSLHNIVLDFDIHERMNQQHREELIEEFIWRMKRDLFFIAEPFRIPCPNMIHRTGRGVQVWFHIHSASAKLLWLYQKLIDNLVIVFKQFLSEYPELEKHISIDTAASKNGCGLYRLFETYNTHTKTRTEIEVLHSNGIDLNQFFKKVCETDAVKEKEQRLRQDIEQYNKKKCACLQGVKTKTQNHSYDALHRKRLAFIKWWDTQQENSIGKRDLMIYLGYNTAIQIMSMDEAKRWCRRLNDGFTEPLPDITYIFDEIKQPFKIKSKTFFEMLGADPEDVHRFEQEYSKQSMNLTRNAEIQKRKEIRQQKKAQAKKMIAEGRTYKEIAQEVELSVSTIARIAAEIGTQRSKPKPWEALDISRATYYRKKKIS